MTHAEPPAVLTAQELALALAGNVRVIGRQVAGLSHADSLLQPPVRGNCLNWVLGHIAVHRDFILEALGAPQVLGNAARERYDRESEPILEDEPGVIALGSLLSALDQTQERIEGILCQSKAADLARKVSEADSTSVARFVSFLYWHETYHVGQTELLRQLAGTDDKVI